MTKSRSGSDWYGLVIIGGIVISLVLFTMYQCEPKPKPEKNTVTVGCEDKSCCLDINEYGE